MRQRAPADGTQPRGLVLLQAEARLREAPRGGGQQKREGGRWQREARRPAARMRTGAHAHQSTRSAAPGRPRPRQSCCTPASPRPLPLSCSSSSRVFRASMALKCWQQAAVKPQDFALWERDSTGPRLRVSGRRPAPPPGPPHRTGAPASPSGAAVRLGPRPRTVPARPPPCSRGPSPWGSSAHAHHRDSRWQPGASRLSHSSWAPSSPTALPATLSSFRLPLALRTRQRSLQPLAVMSHSQSLQGEAWSLHGHQGRPRPGATFLGHPPQPWEGAR